MSLASREVLIGRVVLRQSIDGVVGQMHVSVVQGRQLVIVLYCNIKNNN